MELKHDSNLPIQNISKKKPRSMSVPQKNTKEEQIKKEESLIPENEEQFQNFENIQWVYEWVNLLTSIRENEYCPVK